VYLRGFLEAAHRLQTGMDFTVFTDQRNHESFDPWDRMCVPVAPERCGGSLPAKATRGLAAAVRRSGVDLLFTALEKVPHRSDTAVVPYAIGLQALAGTGERPGWAETRRRKALEKLCAEARTVVAPSRFVQKQMLELLHVPMDRVAVAPAGVSAVFGEERPCPIEGPYLLFVGSTRSSKNVAALVRAFRRLSSSIPHSLVVVGHPGDAELDEWGPRILRIDRFPVPQLAGLYQHCDLLICPARYDGTAVTVLEGMRAGARIVAGRVGAIPELAGEAPIYFNVESVDSLMTALRRGLSETEEERAQAVRTGKSIAREFTWDKCAWKVVSAFKR